MGRLGVRARLRSWDREVLLEREVRGTCSLPGRHRGRPQVWPTVGGNPIGDRPRRHGHRRTALGWSPAVTGPTSKSRGLVSSRSLANKQRRGRRAACPLPGNASGAGRPPTPPEWSGRARRSWARSLLHHRVGVGDPAVDPAQPGREPSRGGPEDDRGPVEADGGRREPSRRQPRRRPEKGGAPGPRGHRTKRDLVDRVTRLERDGVGGPREAPDRRHDRRSGPHAGGSCRRPRTNPRTVHVSGGSRRGPALHQGRRLSRSTLAPRRSHRRSDSSRREGVEMFVHVRTIRLDHDEIPGRALDRHRRQRGSAARTAGGGSRSDPAPRSARGATSRRRPGPGGTPSCNRTSPGCAAPAVAAGRAAEDPPPGTASARPPGHRPSRRASGDDGRRCRARQASSRFY